jgi:hypothetical protein
MHKANQKGFIMKIKYAILPAVLIIVLAMTVLGRQNHDGTTKKDLKKHDMMSMMGKPTLDATVEGLRMKVWLMTQKHHKMMMKEMKNDSMKIDKATKEAMMAGTHHLMLHVTDAASGKVIADAGVKVLILSPSKKNSSVELKPIMNHFGDGLTLTEKGEYQFTVIVKVDGVPKSTQFKYTVK